MYATSRLRTGVFLCLPVSSCDVPDPTRPLPLVCPPSSPGGIGLATVSNEEASLKVSVKAVSFT